MKYFVQYKNGLEKHWEDSWNFKFVIYNYETKVRNYISPRSLDLRTDTVGRSRSHEENQTKVVKYDN